MNVIPEKRSVIIHRVKSRDAEQGRPIVGSRDIRESEF